MLVTNVSHKYDRRTKIDFNLEQNWTWELRKNVTNTKKESDTYPTELLTKWHNTLQKTTISYNNLIMCYRRTSYTWLSSATSNPIQSILSDDHTYLNTEGHSTSYRWTECLTLHCSIEGSSGYIYINTVCHVQLLLKSCPQGSLEFQVCSTLES